MAQATDAKAKRDTLVVLVCDPRSGTVSVNGKAWLPARLARVFDRVTMPPPATPGPSKPTPKPPRPPGDGDDTLQCLRDENGNCKWHCWNGEEWTSLGWDCPVCE
jgi:hypothetical protein